MTPHAILSRRLANGAVLTVLAERGSWFWSAVAADGSEARYSRWFPTECEARRDAVLFANEVELATTDAPAVSRSRRGCPTVAGRWGCRPAR